jgi:drug/metabolite transporter (DMT)-like permease
MPLLSLLSWRFWLSAAFLITVGGLRRATFGDLVASAPGGLLLFVEVWAAFTALRSGQIAGVIVIAATMPIWAAIGAAVLLGERLTGRAWALIAAGVGGALISTIGAAGSGGLSADEVVLSVISTFAAAGFWLETKRVRATVGSRAYLTGVSIVAAILATAAALATEGLVAPEGSAWRWLAALVLLPTVARLLFIWAQRSTPAGATASVKEAGLALTPVWAWLAFGEIPSTATMVGGPIVLASAIGLIVLVSRDGEGGLTQDG